MAPLKTLCGLVAAVLILSGCGGTSGSGSPSAGVSSSATGPASSGSTPPSSPPSTPPSSPPPSSPPSTPPPSPPPSPPPPTSGSATLHWTAPTANSDGSALTDLAGYHIHYGTSATSLSNTVDIASPSTLTYTMTNLKAGTWYFTVSAYTNTGLESSMSNVGSKT